MDHSIKFPQGFFAIELGCNLRSSFSGKPSQSIKCILMFPIIRFNNTYNDEMNGLQIHSTPNQTCILLENCRRKRESHQNKNKIKKIIKKKNNFLHSPHIPSNISTNQNQQKSMFSCPHNHIQLLSFLFVTSSAKK